jgi:hypothetical protein
VKNFVKNAIFISQIVGDRKIFSQKESLINQFGIKAHLLKKKKGQKKLQKLASYYIRLV